MKKLFAILLAMLILVSLSSVAFAEEDYPDGDYLTLQVPSNFDEIFQQSGFPTSYFIDQNGTVISSQKLDGCVSR